MALMPVRSESSRSLESAAMEDYLEQIHTLIESKGYARVVDIAANLGISQASVTNMIQKLDSNGLVIYEKYRGTVLTPAGERIGRNVRQRHSMLTKLLQNFGLEEATIYADVEGMEHHISQQTQHALELLTEELDNNPQMAQRIRQRLAGKSSLTDGKKAGLKS